MKFKSAEARPWNSVILIVTVLLLLVNALQGQEIALTGVGPKLDIFFSQVIDRFDIPGLNVAITQDGKTVYQKAFGVRSLKTKEPMKPEYLFHMASVSKPFMATAIMQLVEQGKMSLDDRLVSILPYFKLADPRYKEVTIRQMLNHTSGFPDVDDYEWDKPQYDDGAAERYARSLATEKMIAAPGERFQYSNMAFDVLANVIAEVSGQLYEIYVKEHILDPLGMEHSHFLYRETPEALRTTPHIGARKVVVSDIYPYNRRHAPSSTLNSSVVEMVHWAEANLNRGVLDGRRILQEQTYDLLWKPSAQIRRNHHVGLSWFLAEYRGHALVQHSGGDRGYSSYLILLPDDHIGIVLASNYDRTPMGDLRNGVLDILMGREPRIPKPSIGWPFGGVYLEEGSEAARKFYKKMAEESKNKYRFGDGELSMVGYWLLRQERYQEAIEVFEFNIELFPDVANVYDSLGEAHMFTKNKEKAIHYYEKALEIDTELESAIRALEKLKAKE